MKVVFKNPCQLWYPVRSSVSSVLSNTFSKKKLGYSQEYSYSPLIVKFFLHCFLDIRLIVPRIWVTDDQVALATQWLSLRPPWKRCCGFGQQSQAKSQGSLKRGLSSSDYNKLTLTQKQVTPNNCVLLKIAKMCTNVFVKITDKSNFLWDNRKYNMHFIKIMKV